MAVFDSKIFNGEVFERYTQTVSDLRRNELLKAGVFVNVSRDMRARFSEQVGSHIVTEPIKGALGGNPVNYDGVNDIDANSRSTISQKKVIVGRAKAWSELDFSSDITGGENFLPLANEVAHYWDNIDQNTLLAELAGIFAMSDADGRKFVAAHSYDISGATDSKVGATTLNTAIQRAGGDNKNAFTVAIMHSAVATSLENQNLLEYLKYTDANGVQRDLSLATWNGRVVLVDDNMPVAPVYTASTDTTVQAGKVYYTKDSSGNYTVVSAPTGNPSTSNYYELTGATYTTYILGRGAFEYADVGATVPYEMDRDPAKNGGKTFLYSRQRKMFAPRGISFTKDGGTSPTDADLQGGANWAIAKSADGTVTYPHRAIPIARIISRG